MAERILNMKKHSVLSFLCAIVLLLSVCMFAVSCNSEKESDPSGTTTESSVSSEEISDSATEDAGATDPEEDENAYPDSPVNADHDDVADDDF